MIRGAIQAAFEYLRYCRCRTKHRPDFRRPLLRRHHVIGGTDMRVRERHPLWAYALGAAVVLAAYAGLVLWASVQ